MRRDQTLAHISRVPPADVQNFFKVTIVRDEEEKLEKGTPGR
jgi:hypothetical protein